MRKRSEWTKPGRGTVHCALFAVLVWGFRADIFAILQSLGPLGRVLAVAVMAAMFLCLLRVAHDVSLLIMEAVNARDADAERRALGLSPIEWAQRKHLEDAINLPLDQYAAKYPKDALEAKRLADEAMASPAKAAELLRQLRDGRDRTG